MGIVFFENFENDTSESIILRYPGTARYVHGDDEVGFPLMRAATSTSAANDGVLEFSGSMPKVERRLDLILFLEDNGSTTGQGNNAGQLIFYNNLRVYANSATNIRIDHSPYTGEGWYKDVPVADVKAVRTLYISIDYEIKELLVIADDDIVLNREPILSWEYLDTGNNNLLIDAFGTGIQNTWFPNFLKAIVVAADLPEGQMFDVNTIQFENVPLEIKDAGTAKYSDQGYSQDVDKGNPLLTEPSVYVEGEGVFDYSLGSAADTLANKIYPAARSDQNMWIQVGGPEGSTHELTRAPTVMFPIEPYTQPDVRIEVSEERPWVSNGLGVEFSGETSLISYADLSTRLGFTSGTLMPESGWLRFRLDGQEMLVAKTSVRYGVSWHQIYQAGLVYGTDDEGLYPYGAATNQWRTVQIGEREYLVRLLKGADEDPSSIPASTDAEGTRHSEWSRLMYAISEQSVNSYTAPKLAEYSHADLGLTGSGYYTWVQETNANNLAQRLAIGNSSVSYRALLGVATASNNHGWRPVLIPLPDHNAPEIIAGFYFDRDKLFFAPDELRGVYISDTEDL